jgi:iron complex outermembrane receptor protein
MGMLAMRILRMAAEGRLYVLILTALCTTAFLGVTFAAPPAQARSVTYNLDIPAQSLKDALQALALASQHKLLYSSELVDGRRSPAVKGQFTTEQAVKALLSGTDLSYEVTSDGLVLIRAADEPPHTSTAPATRGDDPTGETAPAKEGKKSSSDEFRLAQATQGSTQSTSPVGNGNQSSANAQSSGPTLTEIIVTAQKREERLQDVPVPVTALDGSALAETNQLRLQDYYSSVPGLALTPDDNGGAFLSIRGITTGYGTNPTVGITIDDVPYGASATAGNALLSVAPDLDPSELARVEVLRGPQGTLYGAASMGGLLKFVTVDPSTDRLGGQVRAGLSSINNGQKLGYDTNASINVPISNTVAVRASGFTRQDPGYIDNIATGQRGINEEDFYGGRVSALWRPNDDFSLKLSALVQDSKSHGSSYATIGLGDLQQNTLIGTGLFDRNIQAYSANLSAKLGNVDLTSVTGYSNTRSSDDIDLGPAGFGPYTLQQFNVSGTAEVDRFEIRKFTQEIRLSSSVSHWLDWLVGGFFDHENTPITTTIVPEDSTTGTIVGQWLNTNFPTTFTEYAAFADFTVHITDRFDLQLGGRESQDKESISQTFVGAYYDSLFISAASPYILSKVNSKTNAFTYLVTPRFKLSSNWMVYARLASGYRPGGPNDSPGVPRLFSPDKTENYELGTKGEFLDRRMSVEASVYYIDWRNIQLSVYDPQTFLSYVNNASRAKSQGVELTLGAKPVTGLSVNAWLTFNDAVLTAPLPTNDFSYGVSGDRLPYSSRFSANASINYEFPLSGRVGGFAGAAMSYVGDRYGIFTGPTQQRAILPAFAKTDLRAGIKYDLWTVNFYVNNVADKRGVLNGGNPDFPNFLYYIQPRLVGLSIAKTF